MVAEGMHEKEGGDAGRPGEPRWFGTFVNRGFGIKLRIGLKDFGGMK